jgi:hypothetical protein
MSEASQRSSAVVLRRYVLADRKRRTWWQFWLAVTSCAQTDAEVRAELGRQHTSIIQRWRYCLDRGIVDGVFEPGLDTLAHAQRLTAYAHGLAVSQLIDPGQTAWAEAELRHAVDVLRPAVLTTVLPTVPTTVPTTVLPTEVAGRD